MIYGTWGEQLIVDDAGRVTGAYVHDADGVYTQINAKAVVLATGDWGNNQDMRDYFVPCANEFMSFYTTMDAAGNVGNTGDGHLMGLWAGAHMELGPHAPMTHQHGRPPQRRRLPAAQHQRRALRERGHPGQNIADQLSRVPAAPNPASGANDLRSWQIFDSKWPTEIDKMPDGHGYVNHFIPAEEVANYGTVLAGFGLGYTARRWSGHPGPRRGEHAGRAGREVRPSADAVKGLQSSATTRCAPPSVTRRLRQGSAPPVPVGEPPFYAYPFGSAGMLVLMGGLRSEQEAAAPERRGRPHRGPLRHRQRPGRPLPRGIPRDPCVASPWAPPSPPIIWPA